MARGRESLKFSRYEWSNQHTQVDLSANRDPILAEYSISEQTTYCDPEKTPPTEFYTS